MKNSLFDSAEKAFIRENQWGKALYSLVEKEKGVKILEFLGTRWHFWKELKEKYPDKKIIVDGVTLENDIQGQKVYDKVFTGRYDLLIGSEGLVRRFPYHLINLDYCGGGRYFDDSLRYFKLPEITKTIELSLRKLDELHLLVTLDTADLIYPVQKSSYDPLINSPIWTDVDDFLERINNLDTRAYWLMILGNVFEIAQWCGEHGYSITLETEPYTYIAKSIGHKTRMISYYFRIDKKKRSADSMYRGLLAQVKRTYWLEHRKGVMGEKFYNNAASYL